MRKILSILLFFLPAIVFAQPFSIMVGYFESDAEPTSDTIAIYNFLNNLEDSQNDYDIEFTNAPSYTEDQYENANSAADVVGSDILNIPYADVQPTADSSFTWYLEGRYISGDSFKRYAMIKTSYPGVSEAAGDYTAWLGPTYDNFRFTASVDGTKYQAQYNGAAFEKRWFFIGGTWSGVDDTLRLFHDGVERDAVFTGTDGQLDINNDTIYLSPWKNGSNFSGGVTHLAEYGRVMIIRGAMPESWFEDRYFDSVPQRDDLIRWWQLGNSGADRMGNRACIPTSGAGYRWDERGTELQAYDLGGTIGYINTDSTFNEMMRGSFTIAFTAYLVDGQPGATEYILGVNGVGSDLFHMALMGGGKVQVEFNANGTLYRGLTDGVVFANGVNSWPHIALVMDDGAVNPTLRVDGVDYPISKTAGTDLSSIDWTVFDATRVLYLGARNDGFPNGYLDAYFDDIRFWTTTLTNAEIDQCADDIR